MSEQYEFNTEDGHWWDAWNSLRDDEPLEDDYDDGMINIFAEPWHLRILSGLAGWCGCVELDDLADMFAEYLSGAWGRHSETIIHFDGTSQLQTIVALTACSVEFTEHGGNISGSWLTPGGKRWLEVYRAYVTPQPPERLTP